MNTSLITTLAGKVMKGPSDETATDDGDAIGGPRVLELILAGARDDRFVPDDWSSHL